MTPRARGQSRRADRSSRAAVIGWLTLLGLVAAAAYAVAPFVLPMRIVEGPMVQAPSESGATLVWWTSRPGECRLMVTLEGRERDVDVRTEGRKRRAIIDGLPAGSIAPYRITSGRRPLARDGALQTNKPASSPFSFLVFGDSGRGSREQYALAAAMAEVKPAPDLLVHTGDVVYPDGQRWRFRERFFAPYRALLSRVAFWPCLGNHDVQKDGTAPGYTDVFELPLNGPPGAPPEHNYAFDYASARFVVLDTNLENAGDAVLGERVAPWLRAQFEAPGPLWRFAVMHHPPHTAGKYQPDERLQRTLGPVFEDIGVNVVFCGHDHGFQRYAPLLDGKRAEPGSGVVYVVTGAGGAELYELKPAAARSPLLEAAEDSKHSFTHVIVDGDTLVLRQIDAAGLLVAPEYRMVRGTRP